MDDENVVVSRLTKVVRIGKKNFVDDVAVGMDNVFVVVVAVVDIVIVVIAADKFVAVNAGNSSEMKVKHYNCFGLESVFSNYG